VSTKAKKIAITLLFFFIAGLCEIGGGYLVWLWLRDGMSSMFGALGGFVLFLYGVVPTFQSSIVLKCSMEHSLRLGESIFIRIVPDKKIFCFGIGANLLQFLISSQNKNLGNFYVIVPENRRLVKG
jgi:uncharacterized membrane protein YgaE (UPF0421/DUF939 family)